MLRILLLDCNKTIETILKRKGYSVSSGSAGFKNGIIDLPVPLYEQNVIIYNPQQSKFFSKLTISEDQKTKPLRELRFDEIKNGTHGVYLNGIDNFFKNGGLLVTFINDIDADDIKEWALYSWIPTTPMPMSTKDNIVTNLIAPTHDTEKCFTSLFRDCKIKRPVCRKILLTEEYPYPRRLIINAKGDTLAAYTIIGKGLLLSVPTFESNNEAILHIVQHVYPRLFTTPPDIPQFLQTIASKQQKIIQDELQSKTKLLEETESEVGLLNQKLTEENNRIEKLVKEDKIYQKIVGYLEDALFDTNLSWHQIYKLLETLNDFYGGEQSTKKALGTELEINYIKKISNESYRDTRHSPKLDEVVTPPTNEEITKLVDCAKKIIIEYTKQLIDKQT